MLIALLTVLASIPSILSAQIINKTETYIVKKGDTASSIARQYGITPDQLLILNPGLQRDHVEIGQALTVPKAKVSATSLSKATETVKKQETFQTKSVAKHPAEKPKYTITYKEYKVKRKDTPYSLAKANDITVDELIEANPSLKEKGSKLKKGTIIKIPVKTPIPHPQYTGLNHIKMAVILPLKGSETENLRSVEFYRGLLMGLNEAKTAGIDITLNVYNEPDVNEGIANTVSKVSTENPDIIIGPLYPSHFGDVAAVAKKKTKVVIPFSSKVPQVNYNPYLYVVNTPQSQETSLAIDLFMNCFSKATRVIILKSENGNKRTFVEELSKKLLAAGYNVWNGLLKSATSQISSAITDGKQTKCVLISDNTDDSTLKSLIQQQEQLRKLMPETSFSILGYDGWLKASEGQMKPKMHTADTYILTSSYFYPYTNAAKAFRAEYEQWFKASLLDCTPRMAPLGYDLAKSLIGGLHTYGYDYSTQPPREGSLAAQPKLQTDARFVNVGNNGGYVSRSMWLVHFKPDMTIVKINN